MPIYEFTCRDCELTFEELVRGGVPVACPQCGSAEVKRLLSRFAVHSSSPGMGGQGGRSCSSCAGTSCATCHRPAPGW
ncbi:MAG: zinc ribbon domain-containing protein [Actinobacteria bacterium]|nr:zinc ribbon domain-containing protein [Actinomycetota bacterium]